MTAHPATEVDTAGATLPRQDCLECRLQKRMGAKQEFALDVAFSAVPGFTILFGASGAGKTTLLNCVAGLAIADAGRVSIRGRVLFESSSHVHVPVQDRRIGYVFQSLALFPHMTVEQNVCYGLDRVPATERNERTSAVMTALRIGNLRHRNVRGLSGGERQRVALARTLVTNPQVLLLDEPLAALDAPTKSHIIDDLREWNRSHGIPILYVTHSREEVFALGERVIVLDAGCIVAQGTPHEVLSAPMLETVAQLAGFENIFDALVDTVSPERGTMTCCISAEDGGKLSLETPLVRGEIASNLRVGIRAGDILLATSPPAGLSARNVVPGRIISLDQRDVMVCARVKCGVEMEVHLTLAARDSLHLVSGQDVWLVIKTHSCHLMRQAS